MKGYLLPVKGNRCVGNCHLTHEMDDGKKHCHCKNCVDAALKRPGYSVSGMYIHKHSIYPIFFIHIHYLSVFFVQSKAKQRSIFYKKVISFYKLLWFCAHFYRKYGIFDIIIKDTCRFAKTFL